MPARSPPRASTSSSSAAATPAPTASAPCIARAPRRSRSSSCCRRRRTSARPTTRGRCGRNIFRTSSAHEEGGERVYAVATTAFAGDDAAASARCTVSGSARRQRRARRRSSRCPAARSRCGPTWCCWRWASSGRRRAACSTISTCSIHRARHRVARRAVDDQRARRVRRRRHAARPVADRLGDRRRPAGGSGDGSLSQRGVERTRLRSQFGLTEPR